jgi:hypothetical protein
MWCFTLWARVECCHVISLLLYYLWRPSYVSASRFVSWKLPWRITLINTLRRIKRTKVFGWSSNQSTAESLRRRQNYKITGTFFDRNGYGTIVKAISFACPFPFLAPIPWAFDIHPILLSSWKTLSHLQRNLYIDFIMPWISKSLDSAYEASSCYFASTEYTRKHPWIWQWK